MSTAEMQACLARLYVDRAYRRLFALEPETVLGEYRLSAEEAQALRELDLAALERFARSLKSKRRRRFVATYPLLFGLASPAIERYYDRYYQLYPARPGGSYVAELLEFGRFMEECLATDDEAPPFASDLAQYERLLFAARPSGGGGATGHPAAAGHPLEDAPEPAGAEPRPLAPDDRPRLVDGVAVGTFRTSILAIVDALRAGLPPPEAGEGPYTFVFRPGQSGTDADPFYVTAAMCELLDLCDGERTAAEVAAAVERGCPPGAGGDGIAATVAGALQTLVEHAILSTAPAGFRDGPGGPSAGPEGNEPPLDPEAWLPGGH